jgi:TolB-like protein
MDLARTACILLAACLLGACASGQAPSKKLAKGLSANVDMGYPITVAVLPFVVEGGPDLEGKILAEKLTDDLVNTTRFRLIERTRIDQVMREQRLAQTGITDMSTAVALGRLLSAKAIVLGTVYYRDRSAEVFARLVDTESGMILGSASAELDAPRAAKKKAGVRLAEGGPAADRKGSQKGGTIGPEKKPAAVLEQVRTAESYGSVYFYGLVRNTGEVPVKTPHVVVRLRDGAGNQIMIVNCFAQRDLLAGETVPFEGVALNQKGMFADYEVLYTAEPLEYRFNLYELSSSQENFTRGTLDDFRLSGVLTNPGKENAKYAKVIAGFYDAAGGFIGMGYAFAESKQLKPGESAPYQMNVHASKLGGEPARYVLQFTAIAE